MLGICVGLQLLFEEGEEHGGARGLGLLPGRIERLPATVKLPHIGWSPVRATPGCHPLFRPLDGEYVYFAHSYAAPAGRARGRRCWQSTARPTAPPWPTATSSPSSSTPRRASGWAWPSSSRFLEA